MHIAVDLDGVLADTIATFCEILNKRHSTRFTPDSFDHWNAWKLANITLDEFFRTLDEAWFSWKDIPPMEESIGEKMAQIHSFGRVDVVTGRSLATVQPSIAWLREQKVAYDNFVRTPSVIDKADLSYDVFIDDSAELMSLISSRKDRNGILYTQPWNKKSSAMPGIFRVNQWSQIPPVLGQISRKNG